MRLSRACSGSSWAFHLKSLTLSSFFLLISVLQPIIFASIAFFMCEAGAQPGHAALRRARRRADGDVVVDAVRLGRRDPVAALAGDARGARRRAAARSCVTVLPLTMATASIGLYSVVATLFWGRLLFGVPLDFEHPCCSRSRCPATVARARPARARAGVDVRPLPARERVLEPARVPGLARHRAARAALAAARLGGADLVGARADVGRRGRARRGARRRPARADRDVPPALASIYLGDRLRSRWRTSSGSRGSARRSRSRERRLRALLHRRPDLVPRALQLDHARSSTSTTMLGSPLFQILFFAYLGRFSGPAGRHVLRRRERRPGERDVGDLRDDADDRERAQLRDALADPRHAREPDRALPRARAAGDRQRPLRLGLRLRGRARCSSTSS